eukprot:NODE_1077_length_1022_cov_84.350838_g1032_i0.p1 GENE.NODE_1077_length_1022_cov_84.350838_g1032_i0~~NODE_1077_length_1022_cov_84.350838_g1032_i0.p1  ORF type:complete len:256 (+),score=17.83 NODE_1077_length_1022_cov_84.350838_g1032_i0:113-880(+)
MTRLLLVRLPAIALLIASLVGLWIGSLYIYKKYIKPKCYEIPKAWETVGADQQWDVVFVDQRPGPQRVPSLRARLDDALLLILHDAEVHYNYMAPAADQFEFRQYKVRTLVKAGGRDPDLELFHRVVSLVTIYEKYGTSNVVEKDVELSPLEQSYLYVMRHVFLGEKHETFGSHLPVSIAAVMLTSGPVLELGAGYFSTPYFQDLVAANGRHLHSADTDVKWLERFVRPEFGSFHTIEHVLAYSDGEGCYGGWFE